MKIESEGMEENIPCIWSQKKAGAAILFSDKLNLKIKNIIRDKQGHYIMIKGSIQEDDITILNIYTPNTVLPPYIRQLIYCGEPMFGV